MPKKAHNALTTNKFIDKAMLKHGFTYDYSRIKYKTSKDKVEIICKDHGPFWQKADNHLSGKGCAKCMYNKASKRMSGTTEKFVKKARKKHGNKYNYSGVEYRTLLDKVTIFCRAHGQFNQIAADHIAGRGCPQCANENQRLDTKKFIENARKKHGNRYNYSRSRYKSARNKTIIVCFIHGEFKQTPNNHLTGQGCPSCAKSGFDPVKPAILYYIRVNKDNNIFYKIGITNRSIEERFGGEEVEITKLQQWEYEFGEDALKKETQIKKMFKNNLLAGPSIMKNVKNTEIFDFDVLGYDNR